MPDPRPPLRLLSDDDLEFVQRFVLASGSLKDLAAEYGVLLLCVGLYALLDGQPYGIWYPLTLAGGLLALICGVLTPIVRKRYAEAEARRLTAEQFRGQ